MKIDIARIMEEKGISRYELAKRIDVTYPTITNIYKGNPTSIKFEILESICKVLDCTCDDILIFDDQDLRTQQLKRLTAYATMLAKYKNSAQIDPSSTDSE